jgi:pyruvate dehydrogenase E1 component beta subunit
MAQAPCPTAKALEDIYYPDVHDIVVEVLKLAGSSDKLQATIPEKQSMTDFYKHFKGPF